MRLRCPPLAFWSLWLLTALWVGVNFSPSSPARPGPGARLAHQAGLRQQVATLLAAPPQTNRPELAANAAHPTPFPDLPARTLEVKKSDLALLAGPLRVIAAVPKRERSEPVRDTPAAPVTEVPHPPPRASRHA